MQSTAVMRVLVVDDEAQLRRSCGVLFERHGYEVVTAANGNEALDALRDGTGFDAMVTDIIMPDKEGIELIMEARDAFPGLAIVAMSGGGRVNASNYLDMAARLGATTIEKPFSMAQMLEALRGAIERMRTA